jgi:hypothetical protein
MIITCPHCGKEVELPDNVVYNVEAYGNRKLTTVPCCGKCVRVIPIREIRVEAYNGNRTEDDWGNTIK